jgi:hypothetical protein
MKVGYNMYLAPGNNSKENAILTAGHRSVFFFLSAPPRRGLGLCLAKTCIRSAFLKCKKS